MSSHYLIKTRPDCEWCDRAKALLQEVGATYTEEVHDTVETITHFRHAGFRTFPQVFLGADHIGGYTDLIAFLLSPPLPVSNPK